MVEANKATSDFSGFIRNYWRNKKKPIGQGRTMRGMEHEWTPRTLQPSLQDSGDFHVVLLPSIELLAYFRSSLRDGETQVDLQARGYSERPLVDPLITTRFEGRTASSRTSARSRNPFRPALAHLILSKRDSLCRKSQVRKTLINPDTI